MGFARVQNAAGGVDGTSLAVTLPVTPTAGNLLIAVANADALVTHDGSGWNDGPSIIDGNGAYLFWKIAGASEPATVTFTPSVSDYITAGLLEYSGNSATPFDVSSSSTHSGSATNTTQPASMTTTTDHDLGIAVGLIHQSRGTPTVAPDTPVWSGSPSWSTVQSAGAVSGSNVTVWTFVGDNLDLGAAGAASASVSWSTVMWPDAQQLIVAFKPSPTTTHPVSVTAAVMTAGAAGRRVSQLCAAHMTTGGAAARGVGRPLHATVSSAVTIRRGLDRRVTAAVATAVAVRRRIGRSVRRTVTTNAGVVVTSHGPLRNAIINIGAAVDRWIIGPAQRRWKIGPGQ